MIMQLNLTKQEVEFILNSLAQQPYVQVHELIQKIHHQASAQVQPVAPAPALEPEIPVLNGQGH